MDGDPPELTYPPMVLCSCGSSMHDTPGTRLAHEDECHSRRFPAAYTDPTEKVYQHG